MKKAVPNDYDLIVVGAGGAGLSAAVTAAEAGCSVLLLESENKIGGSTGRSQGVFAAADTSVQRALGFKDSVDDLFNYLMTITHWSQPASVVRAYCENAAPTLEWLIALGLDIPVQHAHKPKNAVWPCASEGPGLYQEGVDYPPRGHYPVGSGQAYIDVLDQRRAVLGVELALGTRVQKLLMDGERVVGVEFGDQAVHSAAVAVTCGGFGHDRELIRKYFPAAYESIPEGEHPTTIAAPGSRGDGVRMALQAGASISGINCGLLNTRPSIRRTPEMPPFLGLQPTSLIYVNRDGHRFIDETAPYAVMPSAIRAQGHVVWGIFDEAARLASDPAKSGWPPEFILQCVERGDLKSADTIEALADLCKIPAAPLRAAIEQYNKDLPLGRDHIFLRRLEGLHPILKPPFYAFEYRANDIAHTAAGMTIDAEAHVLNPLGRIIPGLFAAGEMGAGVLGPVYPGGGYSVGNAITMGRVAAKTLARELGRGA